MRTVFLKIAKKSCMLLVLSCAVGVLSLSQNNVQAQAPTLQFKPVKPWGISLQQSRVAGRDVERCSAQTEFDNGFIIIMHAYDQSLEALHVDFRQNIFTPGDIYSAQLSLPREQVEHAFQGRAVSTSLLAIETANMQGLLRDIQANKILGLNVDGNDFQFALSGLQAAQGNFDTCLSKLAQKSAVQKAAQDKAKAQAAALAAAKVKLEQDNLRIEQEKVKQAQLAKERAAQEAILKAEAAKKLEAQRLEIEQERLALEQERRAVLEQQSQQKEQAKAQATALAQQKEEAAARAEQIAQAEKEAQEALEAERLEEQLRLVRAEKELEEQRLAIEEEKRAAQELKIEAEKLRAESERKAAEDKARAEEEARIEAQRLAVAAEAEKLKAEAALAQVEAERLQAQAALEAAEEEKKRALEKKAQEQAKKDAEKARLKAQAEAKAAKEEEIKAQALAEKEAAKRLAEEEKRRAEEARAAKELEDLVEKENKALVKKTDSENATSVSTPSAEKTSAMNSKERQIAFARAALKRQQEMTAKLEGRSKEAASEDMSSSKKFIDLRPEEQESIIEKDLQKQAGLAPEEEVLEKEKVTDIAPVMPSTFVDKDKIVIGDSSVAQDDGLSVKKDEQVALSVQEQEKQLAEELEEVSVQEVSVSPVPALQDDKEVSSSTDVDVTTPLPAPNDHDLTALLERPEGMEVSVKSKLKVTKTRDSLAADFRDEFTQDQINIREEKQKLLQDAPKEKPKEKMSISEIIDNAKAEANQYCIQPEPDIRYNEAERQIRNLAGQIKQERMQCQNETKKLEDMLFDPALTDHAQMQKLIELRNALEAAQEKIKLLEKVQKAEDARLSQDSVVIVE